MADEFAHRPAPAAGQWNNDPPQNLSVAVENRPGKLCPAQVDSHNGGVGHDLNCDYC
jgi:hypothetical protein